MMQRNETLDLLTELPVRKRVHESAIDFMKRNVQENFADLGSAEDSWQAESPRWSAGAQSVLEHMHRQSPLATSRFRVRVQARLALGLFPYAPQRNARRHHRREGARVFVGGQAKGWSAGSGQRAMRWVRS